MSDHEGKMVLARLASLPQGTRKIIVQDVVVDTLDRLSQDERDSIETLYHRFIAQFQARSAWPMDSEMVLEIIAKLAWYIGI